jgi:hypothetical protein
MQPETLDPDEPEYSVQEACSDAAEVCRLLLLLQQPGSQHEQQQRAQRITELLGNEHVRQLLASKGDMVRNQRSLARRLAHMLLFSHTQVRLAWPLRLEHVSSELHLCLSKLLGIVCWESPPRAAAAAAVAAGTLSSSSSSSAAAAATAAAAAAAAAGGVSSAAKVPDSSFSNAAAAQLAAQASGTRYADWGTAAAAEAACIEFMQEQRAACVTPALQWVQVLADPTLQQWLQQWLEEGWWKQ